MERITDNKDLHNCYNYVNGELCFIAVATGRPYSRPLTDDVRDFLRGVHLNDGELPENELVALNRWIMRKDSQIDFEHSKSKQHRSIKIMPDWAKALWNTNKNLKMP